MQRETCTEKLLPSIQREFVMVISGKAVSQWALYCGPKPVGCLLVLSSYRVITSYHLSLDPSVREGGTAFFY